MVGDIMVVVIMEAVIMEVVIMEVVITEELLAGVYMVEWEEGCMVGDWVDCKVEELEELDLVE